MTRGVNFSKAAWSRYGYDPANTSYNPDLRTPVPENPTSQQTVSLNVAVRSNIALAGDRLVLLDDDNETLTVLNPDTLSVIDTFALTGSPTLNAGAAIYDDAYVWGTDGGVDVTSFDGTRRWEATNFAGNSGWITTVNGRVLVPTHSPVSTFRAYDIEDGTELWTRTGGDQQGETGACVSGGQVFFADNNNNDLVAVNEQDGSENWVTSLSDGLLFPPATDGSVVVISDDSGNLEAYDVDDGSQVWSQSPFSEGAFSPAIADGVVYALEFATANIEARNIAAGGRNWNDTGNTSGECGPTIAGDHVYVQDGQSGLVAYNRLDGTVEWTHDITGANTVESNIIAVPGVLYVYGADGDLHKVVEG